MSKAKEIKQFDQQHEDNEKEILILVVEPKGGGSGSKAGKDIMWEMSEYFLAYIDCETNQLIETEGCVCWLAEDTNATSFSISQVGIYRVKVRAKKAPETNQPSLENTQDWFMLLDIISDNESDERLETILTAYQQPVIYEDTELGRFELNKALSFYEGQVNWCGKNILVALETDDHSEFLNLLTQLKQLLNKASEFNQKICDNATENLVELAEDWLNNNAETTADFKRISPEKFSRDISMSELVLMEDGNLTAYLDDADYFWGHVILVEGNINGEFDDAYIAG